MAEAELAIVIRAKDQLTATLRQMGTTVEALARQAREAFTGASSAATAFDTTAARLAPTLAAAERELSPLAAEANAAAAAIGKVGAVEGIARLKVELSAAESELQALHAQAGLSLIPAGEADRIERLSTDIATAEQVLRSFHAEGERIDIGARIAQAEQAFERLGANASLAPLQAEVERGRVELERLRVQATEAGTALTVLDGEKLDRLEREVREGSDSLARMRTQVESVRNAGEQIGPAFSGGRAGVTALTGAVNGLRSALLPLLPFLTLAGAAFVAKKSIDEAGEFADALSDIRAQADLTDRELADLRASALQTTRALGLNEAKEGEALLQAVTDGAKDAAEGLTIFNAAARLGVVGNAETKQAVDLLTTSLNAFRGQGLTAARAADVVFQTMRTGKVEIDDLAGSIDSVAPLAAGLGVSFEELGAIIATATVRGGGFSQAIAGIRAVLTTLTNAGPSAKAALAGLPFDSAAIQSRGLIPVLQDITTRLHGNAEALREVFPDGRSFTALMATLSDGGVQLSRSLAEIRGSAGGVEAALGRKLQDPAQQLGIIFNRLRSEFADAFGSAFFNGVSRAINQMGGMETATKTVADTAHIIGDAFGAALPTIGVLVGDIGGRIKIMIDSLGGADGISEKIRAGADVVASATALILRFSLRFYELTADSLGTIKATFDEVITLANLFPGVATAIGLLDAAIDTPAEIAEKTASLIKERELLQASIAQATKTNPLAITEPDVQESIARVQELGIEIDKLSKRKFDFGGGPLHSAIERFLADLEKGTEAFGLTKKIKVPDIKIDATIELDKAEVAVAALEIDLQELQAQAQAALGRGLTDDALVSLLGELGDIAKGVQVNLGDARDAADGFRAAVVAMLQEDIGKKKQEIAGLSKGLIDARSQAELLGIAGTEAARKMESAFSTDRLKDAEAELVVLEQKLRDISHVTIVIGAPEVKTPKIDFSGLIQDAERRFVFVVSRVGKIKSAIEQLGNISPIEALRRAMESGIEPTLARQVQLIEDRVSLQRDIIDGLREEGVATEFMVAPLTAATDQLEKQADLLKRAAGVQRRAQEREAISFGVEVTLDDAELKQQIDEAKERAQLFADEQSRRGLRNEAISFGITIGDLPDEEVKRQITLAKNKIEDAAAELTRGKLEREAIEFGVSVNADSSSLEQSIQEAQDKAQAFADSLSTRGLIRDAQILFHIDVDGKSPEEIREEMANLKEELDAFTEEHPVQFLALQSAASGLSNAFADVATGVSSASDAFSNFAQSFLRQMIQMVTQSILLESVLGALGLPTAGVPGVLGILGGGAPAPAALGGVFALGATPPDLTRALPFAMGTIYGDEPGMAVRAYAVGGFPGGSGRIGHGDHAGVGGSLPPWVTAYASGGSLPRNQVTTRPTLAPMALFGEAGPEAILPVRAAQGGYAADVVHAAKGSTESVRAAQAFAMGSIPLTRGAGGRLSVQGFAPEDVVAPHALGAAWGDASRTLRTEVEPFALGGIPGATVRAYAAGAVWSDATHTEVQPYARGETWGDARRSLWTDVHPFAVGDVRRSLWTDVRGYAAGGVPDVRAYATAGAPAPAPASVTTITNTTPVSVSVSFSVQVEHTGGGGSDDFAERVQQAIVRGPNVRETIEQAVLRAIERAPSYRAAVRGDRV